MGVADDRSQPREFGNRQVADEGGAIGGDELASVDLRHDRRR
jgi:hypothetical protein